ncbi:hypothetical protein ACH5RR_012958 [Cinchona calisaya]|uniref:Uncharacterized protein n=1 Tax=Cinchona calisaya TaxID=153742 RepID=A0ABD2ZYQ6_9GENT
MVRGYEPDSLSYEIQNNHQVESFGNSGCKTREIGAGDGGDGTLSLKGETKGIEHEMKQTNIGTKNTLKYEYLLKQTASISSPSTKSETAPNQHGSTRVQIVALYERE